MKFYGFKELIGYLASEHGDKTVLQYITGSGLEKLNGVELEAAVTERASVLAANPYTAEGIMCDGSLGTVIEIFAANFAGKQIVLLDPAVGEALEPLLCYTDADSIYADGELKPAPGRGVGDGNDKILFFTSGTTSKNKAVVLTSKTLMASAYNGSAMLPLAPEDNLLCMLPLNHVFGFVCGLLWGLSCGAMVSLGRGKRHYLDDCAAYKPTAVSLVPMLLGFMLKYKLFNPELKLVLIGAGDCKTEMLKAVGAMGIRVAFGYGLTETSSGVAISTQGDPTAMAVCPEDTITLAEDGEILIEAPTCMMQGYYKHKEDSDKVLKDGILYTGDLGRFDENGLLHIIGRKKEILVLPSGTKIFLPEAEGELINCIGNPELALDFREGQLVLMIFDPRPEEEIKSLLIPYNNARERGQQINKIMKLDSQLPRTATGKVKRYLL